MGVKLDSDEFMLAFGDVNRAVWRLPRKPAIEFELLRF